MPKTTLNSRKVIILLFCQKSTTMPPKRTGKRNYFYLILERRLFICCFGSKKHILSHYILKNRTLLHLLKNRNDCIFFTLRVAWSTAITKLMMYQSGKWMQYGLHNQENYTMHVHYDQIIITDGDKVIESLGGKLKGFFKDNILIIVICNNDKEIRKIRLQLVTTNIDNCLRNLSLHFPVVNHNSVTKKQIKCNFIPLEEVLKKSIENLSNSTLKLEVPPNYEEFLKLCLLDPMFVHVVVATNNILDNFIPENISLTNLKLN